jgi:hypothetical protein
MNARTALLIVTLVSIIGLASGCGGGDGGGAGGGAATLTGQAVDDGSLQALRNAVAQVGAKTSDATSANGIFTLAGAPTGTQALTVTAPGHQPLQRSVTLTKGANDVGIWYLPPEVDSGKGAITGRVLLGSSPVGGAVISSGQVSAVSRSDGTGRFTVYNIPAGAAQVTFSDASSGASAWRNITVTAGPTPVDIGTVTLSYGPPPPPIY